MAASTSALPPLTCTAGRHRLRQLLFRCEAGQLVAVCFEACAGRRIRWLCPPAVVLFCRLCFACLAIFACHAHCPHRSCPRSFCFAPLILLRLPLFHSMCARIVISSCVRASSLRELSRWQLQHGPAVAARAPGPFDFDFFFLQSP